MERNKGKRVGRYAKDYVVFDLETTGIYTNSDEVIEISGVKVQNGKVTEEFTSLVNPGRHIPKGASAVNGITDHMVKSAPEFSIVLKEFLDFAGNMVLVGHNIHTFDMNFAYDAAWRALEKELKNDYIDTLYLSRHCLPELRHHKLTDISEYFHIDTKGAHRALNDCMMNQKCFEELGKLWKKKKEEMGKGKEGEESMECPRCGGMLCLRKGKFGAFYGCGNFPSCRYTRNT